MARHAILGLVLVLIVGVPATVVIVNAPLLHADPGQPEADDHPVEILGPAQLTVGEWMLERLVAVSLAAPAMLIVLSAGHVLGSSRFVGRPALLGGIVGAFVLADAVDPVASVFEFTAPGWLTVGAAWTTLAATWTFVFALSVRSLPRRLFEMAAIDGAGLWPSFRHIVWPHLRLVVALVAAVITASLAVGVAGPRAQLAVRALAVCGVFILIQRPSDAAADDVAQG